jgi:hypothetical protein
VAGAAVVAAILSDDPPKRGTQRASLFFPESAGLRWASLDQPAPVRLAGNGTYWIAFRAFARKRPTVLSITGEDGTRRRVSIGTEPSIHLVGPLPVRGGAAYWLAPEAGSGGVFTSAQRLVDRPLAALPGVGFWSPAASDPAFSTWLNTVGTVDVAGTGPPPARVWLSFELMSVDRRRTLTVSAGPARYELTAPERGTRRRVTVGPFQTRGGRVSVRFSSPGAVIQGTDPRLRTVRLSALEAHPTPRP